MSHPFGDQVSQLVHRKHGLSLSKLARGIGQPHSVISLMCQGQRLTGPQARERVVDIIRWLQEQQTLTRLDEANGLLRAAGMADLNPARPEEARLLRLLPALQPASIIVIPEPAPQTIPQRSRLPLPSTSFIGRQRELVEVQRLLDLPTTQLLTLTGTGGCGKTRLGLQVATNCSDHFAGRVFFVSLAPVSDPALVMPTIAQALDIREETGRPLFQRLVERLQQPTLLLLDNFEQVVSAAVQVADLLAACPQLKVLVTSRTVLRVQAEREFPVPPLALPPLSLPLEGEALTQYAAVALFLERVHTFRPNFQLTRANARPVAEICVRLDGLPLALELAAARMRLLPPQTLLVRLSEGLEVLTDGARDAPLRQQTLFNTIQWSYDLLGSEEQRLFRQLATFVGGCTLDAVEALTQGAGRANRDVTTTLSTLLENSLIRQSEQEAEEPRFLMLQTVREYGLEMLAATGELEANRAAHAHYFLALAEQAQPKLQGSKQAAWLRRLEQEHDNLRAALGWILEHAEDEQAAQHRELALRFSTALWEFWRINGHYAEGRVFLERALVLSEGKDDPLRAKALRGAANLAIWQSDHTRAEALARQGLAVYRQLEDTHGIINCLFLLGGIAWRRGQIDEALALYEERVRLMRHKGEPWEVGQALYYLADVTSMHGGYARGQALFEEALAFFQKASNDLWVGATFVHSAFWLCFSLGDFVVVRQRLEEGQVLITKAGNRHWRAECAWLAALLALREGELERASRLAREGLALYREMGSPWFIALTLNIFGRAEARRGNQTAAYSAYQESLALCRKQGEQFIIPFDMEGLAGIVSTQGECRWAAQLWGAAEALREIIAAPLPPFDHADYTQAVAAARAQLGEQAFAAAWQEGRAMTLEQVLAARKAAAQPAPPPVGLRSPAPAKTFLTDPAGLTAREMEVLRLVSQGLTDAQVAEALVISPRTVSWHLVSIYGKLGVSSRSAATRYVIEHQLA